MIVDGRLNPLTATDFSGTNRRLNCEIGRSHFSPRGESPLAGRPQWHATSWPALIGSLSLKDQVLFRKYHDGFP